MPSQHWTVSQRFTIHRHTTPPAAVTALEAAQAHEPGYGRPWSEVELLATLGTGGVLWVANPLASTDLSSNQSTDLNRVIGGFLLLGREAEHFYIARAAVAQNFRRQGAGRQLLQCAIDHCRPADIWLEVAGGNQAARALYGAFGFSEIRRRRGYYQDGQDAIVMRLKLSDKV